MGWYVTNISAESIIFNETGDLGYVNLSKMDNRVDKSYYINQNINQLAVLALGVYVYVDLEDTNFYDYTNLVNKNPDFVKDNYQYIRSSIPYGVEYYDDVILNNNVSYFSDFIYLKSGSDNTKSGRSLVKTTPTGKALADKEDAAFVNTWFYPIIIVCVITLLIMMYLLYSYL